MTTTRKQTYIFFGLASAITQIASAITHNTYGSELIANR